MGLSLLPPFTRPPPFATNREDAGGLDTDEQEQNLVPSRRLIILAVEQGEDIEMDYDGKFALWEVRAALEQAMDWVNEQMLEEYEAEFDSDEDEEDE